MTTGLTSVDNIFEVMTDASVTDPFYKDVKPDSVYPDTPANYYVIKSLTIDFDQLQEGVVIINCHAKNIGGTVNGVPTNNLPNRIKLKEMEQVIINLFKDKLVNDMQTKIQNVNQLPAEKDENIISVRIYLYAINL